MIKDRRADEYLPQRLKRSSCRTVCDIVLMFVVELEMHYLSRVVGNNRVGPACDAEC